MARLRSLATSEPKDDLHQSLVHYPLAPLRWTEGEGWMRNSQAMLNRKGDVKSAVMFVHGWGGDSGSTWEDFPGLIRSLPEMESADAIFFEYPSVKDSVWFAAKKFRMFLIDLLRNPAKAFINPSMWAEAKPRREGFLYERIILVAHSMGAVVVRRSLLDCEKARPEEVFTQQEFAKIRLLLFAPAHTGSRIPLLIGSGLGLDFLPGAAVVGSLLKLYFVSLRDLEEGSPCLSGLARDNREIWKARQAQKQDAEDLRATVFHARNDKVVTQEDFDADYPWYPVMGRNHRTICKPADDYTKPIEALRKMFL
jgi:pimeloyl-ACP methyl ester carboxylesterase